ncbi:MAG: hypothetical protein H6922_02945 [Pseudomonadaceae bacterium]|nr:hypothetical protein [Pseudomonadaceae bacterium]
MRLPPDIQDYICKFVQKNPDTTPAALADHLAEQPKMQVFLCNKEAAYFLRKARTATGLAAPAISSAGHRRLLPEQQARLAGLLSQRPLRRWRDIQDDFASEFGFSPSEHHTKKHDAFYQERQNLFARNHPWPEEITAEAIRLKSLGLSAPKITKQLSKTFANHPQKPKFTRSSVTGKLDRLGLIGNGKRATSSATR